MIEIVYPDSVKKMKDGFGFHRVKVYNDDRILREMIKLRIKAQKHKQDSIYLVCGIEGSGKSLFTLMAAQIFEEETNTEINIENICRTLDELMNRFATLERNAFLTLDESSELDSGRWNEKKTKDIKAKFTAIRERAFIVFICYTNPLKIVTYLREDRIRGVFFIKRAGCAYFYANSPENPHFTEILERWSKDNKTKSLKVITKYAPDFIMYYPEYKGRLRISYNKRKDDHITDVLGKDGVLFNIENNYLTTTQAAKLSGVKDQTIKDWLKKGYINREWVGAKEYIHKDVLNSYLELRKQQKQERKDALLKQKQKNLINNQNI